MMHEGDRPALWIVDRPTQTPAAAQRAAEHVSPRGAGVFAHAAEGLGEDLLDLFRAGDRALRVGAERCQDPARGVEQRQGPEVLVPASGELLAHAVLAEARDEGRAAPAAPNNQSSQQTADL